MKLRAVFNSIAFAAGKRACNMIADVAGRKKAAA
jgi:hypothetical protein